jgi:hypothetical protein
MLPSFLPNSKLATLNVESPTHYKKKEMGVDTDLGKGAMKHRGATTHIRATKHRGTTKHRGVTTHKGARVQQNTTK